MKKHLNTLEQWYHSLNLYEVLGVIFLFRLVAAVFSQGFGMMDDHFVVIEPAQMTLSGAENYYATEDPRLHSIVYSGIHMWFFALLEFLGIHDPQVKMFWVRLLHAFYSMLIPLYGYKLTKYFYGHTKAKWAAWVLGLLWFMPFLGVRNLIEIVCIPPAMMGFYYFIKADKQNLWKNLLIAGGLFALSFIFRYQMILMVGGVGLVMLFKKSFNKILPFTAGFLLVVFLIQGVVDWIVYDYPMAGFYAYIMHNISESHSYITQGWYNYILVILGILLPPISVVIGFRFLTTWKKYAYLFWPVFIFIVFHSIFPNKQERFIFPVLPFVMLLGLWGIYDWKFRLNLSFNPSWLRICWQIFWVLNIGLLIFASTNSIKKSRVNSMYYFYGKDDFKNVLVETHRKRVPYLPKFYSGHWKNYWEWPAEKSIEDMKKDLMIKQKPAPNYIMFFGKPDLTQRIQKVRKLYPDMIFQKKIENSLFDKLILQLNPKYNPNDEAYIYKITD